MKHFPRKNWKTEAAFIRVYREEARREQKGLCAYCREPITYRTATADHVIPKKRNGLDHRNNIVAACEPCNTAKGSMSERHFKMVIKDFPAGRPTKFIMAWSRRRLNLAVEHFGKSLNRAMGVSE